MNYRFQHRQERVGSVHAERGQLPGGGHGRPEGRGSVFIELVRHKGWSYPYHLAATRVRYTKLGTIGRGGTTVTFRDHFYTVDITNDNTSFDVELESADTDVALYLFNPLGQSIAAQYGGRYEFQIQATNKGTYLVMVATDIRGGKGNYGLRITGKVQNLKRIESQINTTTGAWTSNTKKDQFGYAYNDYTLQLTAESNILDVEISSADTFVELYLEPVNGVAISNAVQSFLNNQVKTTIRSGLPKGLYKITARASRGRLGTYTLNTFGQFTDFKKL